MFREELYAHTTYTLHIYGTGNAFRETRVSGLIDADEHDSLPL